MGNLETKRLIDIGLVKYVPAAKAKSELIGYKYFQSPMFRS